MSSTCFSDPRVTAYIEHMTEALIAERELGMPRWHLTSPEPAQARAPSPRPARSRDGEAVCAKRRAEILNAVWGIDDTDSARRLLKKGRMTILITYELLHSKGNRQPLLDWAAANGLVATMVTLPVTVDPSARTISFTQMEFAAGDKTHPSGGETTAIVRPLVVDLPPAVAAEATARARGN